MTLKKMIYIFSILLIMISCTSGTGNVRDEESLEAYLGRAKESLEYEEKVMEFIEYAKNDDMDSLFSIISDITKEMNGSDIVKRILNEFIFPFFREHKELGNYKLVSTETDEYGNKGYGFYLYSVDFEGNMRPFVVCVFREKGVLYVTYFSVNEYVKGHHG